MNRVKSVAGAAWRWLVKSYNASPVSRPILSIEPKLERSLTERVTQLESNVAALTDIIRTMAQQTNVNTKVLMRWSKGDPVLAEIERKHAKGEQIREARRSKRSNLVLPDSTIEVVSALVGANGE